MRWERRDEQNCIKKSFYISHFSHIERKTARREEENIFCVTRKKNGKNYIKENLSMIFLLLFWRASPTRNSLDEQTVWNWENIRKFNFFFFPLWKSHSSSGSKAWCLIVWRVWVRSAAVEGTKRSEKSKNWMYKNWNWMSVARVDVMESQLG